MLKLQDLQWPVMTASHLLVEGCCVCDDLGLPEPGCEVQREISLLELGALYNYALVQWIPLCHRHASPQSLVRSKVLCRPQQGSTYGTA